MAVTEAIGRQELTSDERRLFKLIPASGDAVSNIPLQRRLDWDDERYFKARNGLDDRGVIIRGRGRGGTVRRRIEDVEVVAVPVALIPKIWEDEHALYPAIKKVIEDDWARERRADFIAVEIIADQGRRATGGRWSRPDLVTVENKTYPYVPGKVFDVTTFEIKASYDVNVLAVYEALAHRRAATRAYVLLHLPNAAGMDDELKAIRDAARTHGVGLVVVGDPRDYSTWDELEEAYRVEPDPEKLNGFIVDQLPRPAQEQIARRIR